MPSSCHPGVLVSTVYRGGSAALIFTPNTSCLRTGGQLFFTLMLQDISGKSENTLKIIGGVCVCVLVTQLCLTLCDLMDCNDRICKYKKEFGL